MTDRPDYKEISKLSTNQRIAELMHHAGLDFETMATATKSHVNAVRYWCNGKRTPNAESYLKIYHALSSRLPGLELGHVMGMD